MGICLTHYFCKEFFVTHRILAQGYVLIQYHLLEKVIFKQISLTVSYANTSLM
jgi:hypothetical protein